MYFQSRAMACVERRTRNFLMSESLYGGKSLSERERREREREGGSWNYFLHVSFIFLYFSFIIFLHVSSYLVHESEEENSSEFLKVPEPLQGRGGSQNYFLHISSFCFHIFSINQSAKTNPRDLLRASKCTTDSVEKSRKKKPTVFYPRKFFPDNNLSETFIPTFFLSDSFLLDKLSPQHDFHRRFFAKNSQLPNLT